MGRFTLRLPQSLHKELEQRAKSEGVSLNQYIVYALTRQVSDQYHVQVLPNTAVEQQQAHFQELLQALGDPSVTVTKQFLDQREENATELPPETVAALKAKIASATNENTP